MRRHQTQQQQQQQYYLKTLTTITLHRLHRTKPRKKTLKIIKTMLTCFPRISSKHNIYQIWSEKSSDVSRMLKSGNPVAWDLPRSGNYLVTSRHSTCLTHHSGATTFLCTGRAAAARAHARPAILFWTLQILVGVSGSSNRNRFNRITALECASFLNLW